MARRTFEVEDELEVAAVEQALAMARELRKLADAAPDGQVLAIAEKAAIDLGRRFTRQRLQDVLNAQADGLEKKGGAPGPAPAADRARATGRPSGGSSAPPAT